jgi:cerevisin
MTDSPYRVWLASATYFRYIHEINDPNGGDGVDVYVVDTGINTDHVEFEGRASWGKTILNDEDVDGNGHGTHCAGTIASSKYGVAKKANVIAVKVFGSNGSGSTSANVLGGVVWAANEAKSKAKAAAAEFTTTGRTSHKGSVANMSLGGGMSPALNEAVNRAVKSGLHFAVTAGMNCLYFKDIY